MNWITKALIFGEKIKKVLKKRPSKEDIEKFRKKGAIS